MHCNPILEILAIARLAEVDWDGTGVEWFPCYYEQLKFLSVPVVTGVTGKRADGTETTKRGHDEICPTYRE